MRNVTIAIPESTLRAARHIAAERSTSLNGLIRDFLERLTEREARASSARRRIAELSRESTGAVGARGWTRDSGAKRDQTAPKYEPADRARWAR